MWCSTLLRQTWGIARAPESIELRGPRIFFMVNPEGRSGAATPFSVVSIFCSPHQFGFSGFPFRSRFPRSELAMNHLSLARKYRPRTFADVAVQSHVSA